MSHVEYILSTPLINNNSTVQVVNCKQSELCATDGDDTYALCAAT